MIFGHEQNDVRRLVDKESFKDLPIAVIKPEKEELAVLLFVGGTAGAGGGSGGGVGGSGGAGGSGSAGRSDGAGGSGDANS